MSSEDDEQVMKHTNKQAHKQADRKKKQVTYWLANKLNGYLMNKLTNQAHDKLTG